MLFNSLEFLLFFPVVTLLFYLLPHAYRWPMLLAASCLFYMAFIPSYILILVVTIVIDYVAGIYIYRSQNARQKKLLLIMSIISTCMVLFVFKYYDFFIDNFNSVAELLGWNYSVESLSIILPIGLSFHTFQSLSYVIEVYRGHQKPEKHFGIYSLYVMFYPQLVAGPIERPQNLLHQFREKHSFSFDNLSNGLKQMAWGFFMKLVVADRASIYVNAVYNNSEQHSGMTFMVATVFFAFQIYCDFAGYSNIAIGSARAMGFTLMKNFDRPYFSASISEFWKRWHISLSTWFRDYLYISLGGNRVSKSRRYFNLFFTFLVSGFWHGANWTFVIWGGLNGLYLIAGIFVQKLLSLSGIVFTRKRITILIPVLFTFALTCIAWVFFRAESAESAFVIIKSMLSLKGPLYIPSGPDVVAPIYAVMAIFLLLTVEIKHEFFNSSFSLFNHRKTWIRIASYAGLIATIIMFGVFDGGQFIYFQF